MSTKRRIIKNGIAATLQKVIKVADQLLLVPFFIHYWGADYYGEWLTLTIVPATLALADFGFGSAAANTFLLRYARGDKQGAADISRTGTVMLTFLIVVAIILSGGILLSLNYYGIFNQLLIENDDAIIAVLLLLIARIVNFYQALYEAYYRAAKKADISIHFKSFIALVNVIVGLVVLSTGGRVVEYAFAILIVAIVLNPLYIYVANRFLGLHMTHIGQVDRMVIKPLIKKGLGYFLSPIWQAIYYQGMTFVVRVTLGPVAVTIFNTLRTLVRSSSQAFAMTITAVFPDFQFEMGAGNRDKAKAIFIGALTLNITMALLFIVGLTLCGQSLYHWWTKNALEISPEFWLVFISGIFFYALWYTFSFVFEALNKPYTNTVVGLVCSAVAVGLSWCLCSYIGIIGAAISCLVFDILMCIYLVKKGKNELKLSYFQAYSICQDQVVKVLKAKLQKV